MKMNRICLTLILSFVLLCGCSPQKVIIDDGKKDTTLTKQEELESKDDEGEVYLCDIVNESVSKYPVLNTTDIAIAWDGYGPMIVSPYVGEEVVRAVTHVICETQIEAYCYGDYLYDKYSEDFSWRNFEDVYTIIQARVDQARLRADSFHEKLMASIERDSEIKVSPDGEYYYILKMDDFEESAKAIQDSIDRQAALFDFDMQFYCEYYFVYDKRTFIGGYRGPTYAIYLDTYSAENKIYEYYYWKAKHDWIDIYTELYASQIYDYTKISEQLGEQSDYQKQLICNSELYQNTPDFRLYSIRFTYRMFTGDFDLLEAVKLSYEVYTNVCNANAEYNTHKICGMHVEINNFTDYEKEYSNVDVYLPFEKAYSFEEFEKMITEQVENAVADEPV